MKSFGITLVSLGVMLIGLAGLEKVLIFLAFKGEIHEMTAVINSTPSYIWNITNYTFGFGVLQLVLGLGLFFKLIR